MVAAAGIARRVAALDHAAAKPRSIISIVSVISIIRIIVIIIIVFPFYYLLL